MAAIFLQTYSKLLDSCFPYCQWFHHVGSFVRIFDVDDLWPSTITDTTSTCKLSTEFVAGVAITINTYNRCYYTYRAQCINHIGGGGVRTSAPPRTSTLKQGEGLGLWLVLLGLGANGYSQEEGLG